MLPEALSNDACSLRPGADRLAVTVELDFEGAKVAPAAFYRSLIRSDARLDYPQVDRDLRRRRARRGAVGGAAGGRPRRRPRAAARCAPPGARWRSSPSSRSSPSTRGPRDGARAEEQTESHQLIEHLMIAANEAVAACSRTARLPALYRVHEPPDGARVQRLADQLAALDVPTPPLPETLSRRRRPRPSARSRAWSPSTCARPATARRADDARAAGAQAGLLLAATTSATPACARRATATSPRRSAATPTSSCTARCWRRSGRGRTPPPRAGLEERGVLVLGARARRDGDRARGRRRRAAASCSSSGCSRAAGSRSSPARSPA